MKQEVKKYDKYDVRITKNDGAVSWYRVVALSAGGAEETCLREVYAARYAFAKEGWANAGGGYDLISRGAAIAAVDALI